jgi:hypothetical protein
VGFFHSGQDLYANEIRPDERWLKVGGYRNKHIFGREQVKNSPLNHCPP